MGIMQLINIALFWVFLGVLCSFLAKKRGRRQLPWFFAGLCLGIFGIVLLYILPGSPAKKKFVPPPRPQQSEAWLKMWYFVDKSNEQKGPIEFPDMIKFWRDKTLNDKSLIWGEGMDEWKHLSDLPEVVEELDKSR